VTLSNGIGAAIRSDGALTLMRATLSDNQGGGGAPIHNVAADNDTLSGADGSGADHCSSS
jgi:hypothetical protein